MRRQMRGSRCHDALIHLIRHERPVTRRVAKLIDEFGRQIIMFIHAIHIGLHVVKGATASKGSIDFEKFSKLWIVAHLGDRVVQPALDCAHRQVQRRRNFFERHVFHKTQDHGFAMRLAECIE